MRDQLAALAKLGEIDAKARDTDRELKELPARIEALRSDVQRLEQLLDGERQQLKEAELLAKEQDEEIQAQQASLAQSKSKAAKARNMREADAVERELEVIRRTVKDREDERENLRQAIEKVRASLAQHEKEFNELLESFKQEEEKTQATVKELEERRSVIVEGRSEVAARVDKIVLRRYDRIRDHYPDGRGVAAVQDGTCSACFIALPPQLVIKIQRAEEVEQCPGCMRLLFHRDHLQQDEGGTDSANEAAAEADQSA